VRGVVGNVGNVVGENVVGGEVLRYLPFFIFKLRICCMVADLS
jgi:hypothetical protein